MEKKKGKGMGVFLVVCATLLILGIILLVWGAVNQGPQPFLGTLFSPGKIADISTMPL